MTAIKGLEAATPVADDSLYEVIDGKRVELPPMGVYEGLIANILGMELALFARDHQLGWAVVEILFRLPNAHQERRPDVAFVSFRTWARNRPLPRGAAWPVVPELAVEVVSPTNTGDEIILKMQDYFRAGVQRVWVVWPSVRQVYVYESLTQVRILSIADQIDGAPVLPGFQLPVATLFETEVEGQAPLPNDP